MVMENVDPMFFAAIIGVIALVIILAIVIAAYRYNRKQKRNS